jgi:Spy/CpxP family protein refolding chaperone
MKRLAVMILALMAATTALAADLELPPGRWWENERLTARIGLSDEQRGQIRDLVYQHAHRMIDLTAAVKRCELDLANVVEPPEFEAAAARRAFAALQDARRALEDERFEMLLAVRGVLTGEQWTTIQELRRELRRSRERPLGPSPPGDRPPGGGPIF